MHPQPHPRPPPNASQFAYTVTVPLGATATVHLPTMGAGARDVRATESGADVWAKGQPAAPLPQGVVSVRSDGNAAELVVTVGSGTYAFVI